VGLLLVLLSAALYAASFPPLALGPLMWVALAPLFVAASRVGPLAAGLLGLAWGAAVGIGIALFLPGMLAGFFGVPTGLAWLGLLAAALCFVGSYAALLAAWLSWLARRGTASPLLVAAGFCSFEFARANLLVPNPWGLSAYSQLGFSPVVQIADLGGPYGIGFLIGVVNALLACLFVRELRGRRPAFSAAAVSLSVLLALGYGAWRLSQPIAMGEPLRVALIQANIDRPLVASERTGSSEADLARYIDLTMEVTPWAPDLVFWPESAVDFYLASEDPLREQIFDAAWLVDAEIVLGGPHYLNGEGRTRYRNSLFSVNGDGLRDRYDKVGLMPFAEDGLLPWLGDRGTARRLEPGDVPRPLDARGVRVAALICSEAMRPRYARRLALDGAELLVNPSNDAWFGSAAAARHQLEIATLRAIENRRYLVRPVTTGYSAIVDPHGRLVALADFGASETLVGSVRRSNARTPYQRFGDAVAWAAVAGVLLASLHPVRIGTGNP
jgi:apolipoprotein N-acyltransferase